ncbi:hypothetical protein AB2T77_12695 [Clostridium butyricum]
MRLIYGWPIKIIKMRAHLTHKSEGYIDESVIIPNGIPGEPPLPYHVDTWLSAIRKNLNRNKI